MPGVAGQRVEGVQVVAAFLVYQAEKPAQRAGTQAAATGSGSFLQLYLQGIAVAGVAQRLPEAGGHGLAQSSVQG